MTNISPRGVVRYLAVAALALAIPLSVLANPANPTNPREAVGVGHCSGMDGARWASRVARCGRIICAA